MDYDPETLIGLHAEKFKVFYADGVLEPKTHWRLVENAEAYAQEAGIRVADLHVPFKNYCNTEAERVYVTALAKRRGKIDTPSGIYYSTDMDPPIIDRMRGITGTMLRNFIPAKLITQRRFFDMVHDNEAFDNYALLCLPDLFRGQGQISEGLRRAVASTLLDRYLAGQQTCMGRIGSISRIKENFGDDVADLMANNFMEIGGNSGG